MNRNRKARANKKAAVLLSTSLLTVMAVVAYFIQTMPPARDTVTSCRTDGQVAGHTIIMVDRSEAWSAQQLQLLSNAIRKVALELPIDGRLSFGTFSGPVDPENLFTFDRCNPGDEGSVSWLTARPDLQRKKYQDTYLTPISELIRSLNEPKEAKTTHITHLLGSIAARFTYRQSNVIPEVVLFSDMREHNSSFSFYAKRKPKAFARYFKQALPTTNAVFSVAVYELPVRVSHKATPHKVLEQAWHLALTAQGISLTWHRL